MTSARETAADGPDGLLIQRARRGDVDAFSELVRRYQRPLMAKALSSTRNVADADDMVQETFLRAWHGLDRFRNTESVGAWLFQVLRNLLADRGRRSWREVSEPDPEPIQTASDLPGPEQQLLVQELRSSLVRALAALPAGRQRDVFRMRYFDGMAIQEIAARLGVHSGTIKVHLHRTTQKLKVLLGPLEATR